MRFWRSVVGKLAVTILLLVSFVLFILTILLLEFFKDFHIEEAEEEMMQTATNASKMVDEYDDTSILLDSIELIKDPLSGVAIIFEDGNVWYSKNKDGNLFAEHEQWMQNNPDFQNVIENHEEMKKEVTFPNGNIEGMVVGTPVDNGKGAVFVYQTLDVIHQTKAQTTKIIFHAAGIAIILTIIFAVFLSTRITSPLIKMREAAFELARGEFNTKVPILTHDEIGELGVAFNRMGRQLKFHINALRQEKEQLSGIVSSMADGVITLNRNGNMIVTNPPAKRFIDDWYYESNVPRPTEENDKLPEDLIQIFQTVINGEKEVLREVTLQGRSWVMIMTPLYDGSYVRGAVAVIRDMTEERQMDKLRKDFIANVSHELRTPISLLQGYSEAIVDDIAASPQEKNELAQIIYEESMRLSRLVNELLDLARMEAGHIQLNLELVNVENYISKVIRKFKGAADENQIQLTVSTDIQQQDFMFDQDRIEQVLTNLIDNAIRHTSDGGEVNVHVTSQENQLSVDIKDSGAGIPEEDIPFVFDRFYKADKSRTRNKKKKGTGLGLAIAKNIIDAHNGTITVKSKLNQGTTFSFTIPFN
ncbi:MAG TPA: ATP-binding protein [Virgibacillus sp.]|nr:ATP-binding protein [Virgibacillus sp.]